MLKRNLKYFFISAALSLIPAVNAYADCYGSSPCCDVLCGQSRYYGFINAGYAPINYSNQIENELVDQGLEDLQKIYNHQHNQIGVGLGLGYEFNRYFAIEGSINYFAAQQYELFTFSNFTEETTGTASVTQKNIYAAMLFGKLTIPVCNCLSAYVRLGAAYEWAAANFNVYSTTSSSTVNGAKHHLNFAYGLGLDYRFNRCVSFLADWTSIQGKHTSLALNDPSPASDSPLFSTRTPTVNFFSLGVRYYFN